MNFCSGFCVNGLPCLNHTKNKFCKIHDNNYEECGICYEPMVQSHTFECNHSVCKSCMARLTKATSLQAPVTRCPFCRNPCTNNIEMYLTTILNIYSIIERLEEPQENSDNINNMLVYIFQQSWILSSIDSIEEFLLDYYGKHFPYIEQKNFKLMRRVFS